MAKYLSYIDFIVCRPTLGTYDVFTLQSKKITVVIYSIVVDRVVQNISKTKKRRKIMVNNDENSVRIFLKTTLYVLVNNGHRDPQKT